MHEHPPLNEIINGMLPALLRQQKKLQTLQQEAGQVDGEIVGTGQSDFTKNNVVYAFEYQGKPFRLIDVPGIEGNESEYETMVEAAIAKAHLVFYVNGTNKKPEAETVKKIKRYLKYDAQVYAICNVKGKADSYEFESDRVALEQTHKDAQNVCQQTYDELKKVLGAELITGCQSLQGGVAFSAVAYDSRGLSSIHPARADLKKAQHAYCGDFSNTQEMRRFSQIDLLEQIIASRCPKFKEDIVEINKDKVLALLKDTLKELQGQLKAHQEQSAKIVEAITACKKSINNSFKDLMDSFRNKHANALNGFFDALVNHGCPIIAMHVGDKKVLEDKIREQAAKLETVFFKTVRESEEKLYEALSQKIENALKKLQAEVTEIRFLHHLNRATVETHSLASAMEDSSFTFADAGGFLLRLGSLAGTGFMVGSLPGAVVGAVIGLVYEGLKALFLGKDKKIAEAQGKFRKAIDIERENKQRGSEANIQSMRMQIKQKIDDFIFRKLDGDCRTMTDINKLLADKVVFIKQLITEVEGKPYGTI